MNLHIRVLHNGLTTKLFSAECGSPLNSSRVATANLALYPTIIPAFPKKIRTAGRPPMVNEILL